MYTTKTIDLLHGSNTGEKEPKTKWLLAILGVLCLGGGYTISIISKNPVSAIGLLFIAIVLVVIGTYFIFVAGIIALLKLLRKNKGFYYKTSHFISISGMIYRMKQNAVGLANICVLSTMVLVMVSTTSSLVIGMQDTINTISPYDYSISVADGKTNQQVKDDIKNTAADNNLKITKFVDYEFLEFNADLKYNYITASDYSVESENLVGLIIVTQQDYNMLTNSNVDLSDDQVMMFYPNSFPYSDLTIFDQRYKVKESRKISDFIPGKNLIGYSIYDSYGIVVKDNSQLQQISKYYNSFYGNSETNEYNEHNCCFYECNFNVDADLKKQLEFNEIIKNSELYQGSYYHDSISSTFKSEILQAFRDTYSSMFFLGIFLSILFIMATILIIYYKQISDDDKERYEIMQNVGMSHTEVKRTIRSQVLTVFFLPLIVAGVHVAFAFPIMSRVLSLLGLINVTLYITCTVICFLVFALMYGIIFAITSRLYYKTVNKKQA